MGAGGWTGETSTGAFNVRHVAVAVESRIAQHFIRSFSNCDYETRRNELFFLAGFPPKSPLPFESGLHPP